MGSIGPPPAGAAVPRRSRPSRGYPSPPARGTGVPPVSPRGVSRRLSGPGRRPRAVGASVGPSAVCPSVPTCAQRRG